MTAIEEAEFKVRCRAVLRAISWTLLAANLSLLAWNSFKPAPPRFYMVVEEESPATVRQVI